MNLKSLRRGLLAALMLASTLGLFVPNAPAQADPVPRPTISMQRQSQSNPLVRQGLNPQPLPPRQTFQGGCQTPTQDRAYEFYTPGADRAQCDYYSPRDPSSMQRPRIAEPPPAP